MQHAIDPQSLTRTLQERFRLEAFRKGQREIITSVLRGRDTMAVMPTGGGKSLCYQFPAVQKPGIVVVISPLIALMQDQAQGLQRLGIPSGCLHSAQSQDEKRTVFSRIQRERNFVLYLSPERAQKPGFAEWVRRHPISLFAVDEAHCISQWGPDFRKDYHRLSLLREIRPDVPILALTATATPTVLTDIGRQLRLKEPERHVHGFYRPNLYYQVEVCEDDADKLALVKAAVRRNPTGRALIYCGTRRQTEALVEELSGEFSDFGYYHAGLDAEERTRVQQDFERGRLRILAATNAFGMGVDYPDVRLVMHYQMPANIESFYQEMGRAGRDGGKSTCLLLYSRRDKGLHAYFIQKSEADNAVTQRRWRALDTMIQFAEGGECRHAGILTYFRDSFRMESCGHCDVCAPNDPRRIPVPSLPSVAAATSSRSRKSGSKRRSKEVSGEPLTPEEQLRAESLRQWRKEYADAHDLPAFVIFSNKTLRDLAQKNPQSLDELERVYGMGPRKIEHLGGLILEQLQLCDPG